ncbi:bifunctional pyr operon transcriptional regulator/uracil phosphoribosyltransferase PyrR [Thiohalobacter sp. IOR34]|uniref:bifunctional pyr operon transcriptional regulator/uracil phosphoribosyltransferase PyrR n=1 Tax=Thiohalobacter sp. IOR34 TaxID=3057176 RepID=UPI0025B25111|nr:bifunctional pyr operon transcriptional regulator/uracil phosphoribosyltransferase PyrR [Thiohalobacter sp. IOR34]WJW75783.1 bifunctional pyr operon transcriptional regulator/uracil phosphoribosyltransferase PyrR [Thiohalobacter sp. IOR34]
MADSREIEGLLERMGGELRELMRRRGREDAAMVGIHTGGVWIAERLHPLLELEAPLGTLDISFYRDDFTRIGMNPQVRPSELPFTVDERHIILVDDVLHTGRTIRAALNELFDYGRPASITLAVLVERSGRELPIEADVVGLQMPLAADEHVKLSGPEPLTLEVQKTA